MREALFTDELQFSAPPPPHTNKRHLSLSLNFTIFLLSPIKLICVDGMRVLS